MTQHTPVERFLVESGEMPDRSRTPTLNFVDPLRRFVEDWCITQQIAEPVSPSWRGSAGRQAALTQRGRRMCLELDIDAATFDDINEALKRKPALLLRILDWLVRDAHQRLLIAERARNPYGVTVGDHKVYRAKLKADVQRDINVLQGLLSSGNSAWTIDHAIRGLAHRLSSEERTTYETAISGGDVAAAYLQEAWAAAWGVLPNGDLACAKAVDALEAAFRREVCPNDDGASLGKIARDLRAKPEKWSARLDDARPRSDERRRPNAGVSLLSKSLGVIFAANHRHGATDEHSTNSLDDGRDAVTLATALIAMQRRGFLVRAAKEQ